MGVWRHWPEGRRLSFVGMYVELGRNVVEIARTNDQFLSYAVIRLIVANDGISGELVEFARRVGVNNLSRLDALTMVSGDDPKGFSQTPPFNKSTPLASCRDIQMYDGDFPVMGKNLRLSHYCSFEFSAEWLASVPKRAQDAPWLESAVSKPVLFQQFLDQGSYSDAWFTLNSSGWSFSDAANALEALALKTCDPYLEDLVACWKPFAEKDDSGY